MENIRTNEVLNPRLISVLFLGFASGLPLALTSSTLQAWFTSANISLITIGSLSLLGLPYNLKFLWAPLMDQYKIPFWGKRKGWILLTQFFSALSIFILANLKPEFQISQMYVMAFILVFFSASQDIAIDAYRTDILEPEERGLGATYFVFAYRMAMLVAGGLALIFADNIGWRATYEIMALLILLSMVATAFSPAMEAYQHQGNLFETIKASVVDVFKRDKIGWLLLLILFYKFGDALAISLMTNFLLHGLGFTLTEVGVAYKIFSIVAILFGGIVGGLFLTRLALYHALLYFGLAQAFSNLFFVLLAFVGKNFYLMSASVFIENFCSGMSTAAFFAFLMSLCNKRYTATQYAFFVAIASLGRVLLGPVAAYMVQHLGWVQFYWWAFILCFPGIFFLVMMKDRVLERAHATAN